MPGIDLAWSGQRIPMLLSSSVSRVKVAFFLQNFSLQMSGLTGLVCGCPFVYKSPQLSPKALLSSAFLDVCRMSGSLTLSDWRVKWTCFTDNLFSFLLQKLIQSLSGTGSLLTMSRILCAAHLEGREAPSLAKVVVSSQLVPTISHLRSFFVVPRLDPT